MYYYVAFRSNSEGYIWEYNLYADEMEHLMSWIYDEMILYPDKILYSMQLKSASDFDPSTVICVDKYYDRSVC